MSEKLTVYYDGLCHLCSREINHYRTMKGAENIYFVDITSPEFHADQEGLDPIQIHKTMHVRDRQGQLHLGVNAFIWIWNELSVLKFLVPIARTGPVHLVLESAYSVFAKVRPFLPRKSCETSPYCETPSKP